MANLAFSMHDLRARCRSVRATDDGFVACCPAHDDRTPSLSVSLTSERILVHCHAGCHAEDVLRSIGMTYDDLFADGCERTRRSASRFTCAPPREEKKPPPDYGPLLAHAREIPEHRLRLLELADHLGASPESRDAYADAAERLGVVWLTTRGDDAIRPLLPYGGKGWIGCWGIPERDAAGVVVGVCRRYADGRKQHMPGGHRGLVYDASTPPTPGQSVVCVEGASDVIALLACGVCAVGRPSNTGGSAELVELASRAAITDLIVMGENDRKPDGRHPGMEGVTKVGTLCHTALPSTNVKMAFPQEDAKDAREWVKGRCGADVGKMFIATLAFMCWTLPGCGTSAKDLNGRLSHEVSTPNKDTKPDAGNEGTGTSQEVGPIAGMIEPPSPCTCGRRIHAILSHAEDGERHRVQAMACNCWTCPVCAIRLGHEWATHLIGRIEESGSRTQLRIGHITATELASITPSLSGLHGADYAALETSPGVYLFVVAATPTAQRWSRLTDCTRPIGHDEAARQLADWYASIATSGRAFSPGAGRKKCRPVITSKGWALRREKPAQWYRVAVVGAVEDVAAAQVVSQEGGRVTKNTSRLYGVYVPPDHLTAHAVWAIEWRSGIDVLRRVVARLAILGEEAEKPPAQPKSEPDLSDWINPFSGVA